jgi:hypothetical protein
VSLINYGSQNSAIVIVTGYGQCPQCPDKLWGPPGLLSKYGGSIPALPHVFMA